MPAVERQPTCEVEHDRVADMSFLECHVSAFSVMASPYRETVTSYQVHTQSVDVQFTADPRLG